jgi:hypothetical protein
MWNWVPATLIIVVTTLASIFVALQPDDPRRLTAVFPPWWSREECLDAAARAGAVTGFGGLPFIIAVRGEGIDLETRLRAAGAIIFLDGSKFGFCAK